MHTDHDEALQIKRIKVLDKEAMASLGIEENFTTRAMVEILLEVCDANLEVWISEAELKTLTEIYGRLYLAAPFPGVHEMVAADTGVELFFADLRELVQIEDQQQRLEAWVEIFKDFGRYIRDQIVDPTPWTLTLNEYAQGYLLFHFHYVILTQRPNSGKKFSN